METVTEGVKTKFFSENDLHELMVESLGPFELISTEETLLEETLLNKGDVLLSYVFQYKGRLYEFELIRCSSGVILRSGGDTVVKAYEVETYEETVTRYRRVKVEDSERVS